MINQKPKILIFSLAYSPFIGGAEIAVQEITKRLADDFEFNLITCNLDKKQTDKEQIGNVKIYRVGKGKIGKLLFPWLAYKKAKELQVKNNYRIVWAVMANQAGLTALKFKEKFSETRYLLTLQEGDSISHIYWRTWFWFWRYKKIYQKADHIQVISNWLLKRAKQFGYKKEISVVPNGVGLSLKHKNIKTLKQNNEKIILTVSRLVKKNGIADLINAYKLLITHYSLLITKLQIIGDGPLKNKLQKLTEKLNIKDKVFFLGSLSQNELLQYYTQADVFCRPSLSEGLGNVFLEAMANEVPVIATPVGGIPDFLKDSGENQTGWFCEPKNPKSIAEKIKYVLDERNKEEVARVVKNAQKMVMEKYTWEKVAGQMEKIFKELSS